MRAKNKTIKIVYTAVMVAIISILSALTIPTPLSVPLTLSIFALAFCGYFLGAIYSLIAVVIYIVAGGIGLPIFSGFTGGLGILLGVSGGFIFGYIPLVVTASLGNKFNSPIVKITFGCLGVIICHLIGAMQYSIIMQTGFFYSILIVSLPYLLKDFVLVGLAYITSSKIKKALEKKVAS